MGEQIKRIKRELQCKGSITDYYKDTVMLPDGREEVWDFVGHNAYISVIPNEPDTYYVNVPDYGEEIKVVSRSTKKYKLADEVMIISYEDGKYFIQ